MKNYLLKIALSLITALLISTILSQIGVFGSCFEGSCGYISIFLATPVLTIIFFIGLKGPMARWTETSFKLAWLFLAILTSPLTSWFVGAAALIWAAWIVRKQWLIVQSKGSSFKDIFLKSSV